jgi:hypothetical protein
MKIRSLSDDYGSRGANPGGDYLGADLGVDPKNRGKLNEWMAPGNGGKANFGEGQQVDGEYLLYDG